MLKNHGFQSKYKKMIIHRDSLYDKWNKNCNDKITEKHYKKFRNRVVYEIRKSKSEYFKNYFDQHKTSMKKIWSGIRKIVNTQQSSSRFISQISVDGKDLKDSKQIANAFNNFFVNVAYTVNKDIPLTFKSPNDYLKNPNPQSLFLYPVTKLEIEDIIDSLNSSKASGPFSIPIKLLKLLRSIVSDPICLLINDSFLTGQFPDKLKLAKTIPLHKKGSTLNMNNYRPISLLSVFSKIYEKIMYARQYQFLEKSELFYSLQFGFRAKHSTNHALISITETIKESIDNNKLGCGVFLDLRKAFDTVNHKILLEKL